MRGRKWTVTAGVAVLIVVGVIVSTVFARRSVHQEQARVRAAVARAYPKGSADVVSCKVAGTPSSQTNAPNPKARYDCVVVVHGCRQTRRFSIPVVESGTPGDAVAKPLGPPTPRRCG
jgi:hypothetical protein